MKRKLLILDDDPAILDILGKFFSVDTLEIFLENSSDRALERVRDERPSVALVDITMPGKSGLEVMREIHTLDRRICVIMMTGNSTTRNAIDAMKHGAYDYLTKPLDFGKLETVVESAFQSSKLSRDVRIVQEPELVHGGDHDDDVMIGSSPEMIEIWKMIGKIADSNTSVLIQGESGTGKELLARSIYSNSLRKDMPFLAVNCAAIHENLLESELFGHEKGAFTDAVRRHIGKFEQCNGGTLFLDEIAEMSLKNQAKLLRVLENQEFERVGGSEAIRVDVRIIAATNRSLITAVKERRFRLDLFYRIRVISVFLPPLRERQGDIPLLVAFFVRKYARESGKPQVSVSAEAMRLLVEYPWPGNIREMKNVICTAIITGTGDTVVPKDLEPLLAERILDETGTPEPAEQSGPMMKSLFERLAESQPGAVYDNFIAEAERSLIALAMEHCNHNQVHAANFLGISRNKLRQRLELFRI